MAWQIQSVVCYRPATHNKTVFNCHNLRWDLSVFQQISFQVDLSSKKKESRIKKKGWKLVDWQSIDGIVNNWNKTELYMGRTVMKKQWKTFLMSCNLQTDGRHELWTTTDQWYWIFFLCSYFYSESKKDNHVNRYCEKEKTVLTNTKFLWKKV